MKKAKRMLKLTSLNSENLNEKELHQTHGGWCHCGCFWAACGGSSNYWNNNYNTSENKVSPLPPEGVDAGIVV